MDIPQEIKDLEAKFHNPSSDGFTKCECRQKLMAIKDKTNDKAVRNYISEILKRG